MEKWQLTLIILASVFVGALIPLLVLMAVTVHRAGKKLAELGAHFTRILTQVEIVSNRVECLSRGFAGQETNIADLLTSVGQVAKGLERNMKIINLISTILASLGTIAADFVKNRFFGEEAVKQPRPNTGSVPERESSREQGDCP